MPIYEYQCRSCSLRFELHRRFEEQSGASCPRCHSEARHILSLVPIVFKGPGFYVTDKDTSKGSTSGKRDDAH